MINFEEARKKLFNALLLEEPDIDFPEFIYLVRKARNIQRRTIHEQLGISHTRMHYLEKGRFVRVPPKGDLLQLERFYGLPQYLLIRKASEYIEHRKNKSKKKYVSQKNNAKSSESP